ncbi:hypothetical protein, partial [Vibrio parahaemolyticus]|uniref:hypothetical protein n=1 Tax=Vibrio parahaemolyticus TaxID=670 RepID=UPI00116A7906
MNNKLEYLELLEEKARRKEYNAKYFKLKRWLPYKWQKDFCNYSKEYKQRYLRSGNRCGKTHTEAHDFAMHCTGL